MAYVLGIDLGTSSLKGLVFDKEANLLATYASGYDIISPRKGYSEQDPKVWLEAFDNVLRELLSKIPDLNEKLEGISFSGQMHSLVLLDENKEVLRNAILWNDVRTTEQCKRIINKYGEQILEINKNKVLEGFTLPKILWVQENEPEIWAKARHILLPKDYLRFWLTDELHMDLSDAAGTLLLDIENKEWSNEVSQEFDVPMEMLPKLVESVEYVGDFKGEIKEKYGFKNDVKVFAGGADNACSAVGSGIVSDDTALASVGTSGVFLAREETGKEEYEGKVHYFNHAIPDAYYTMGVTLAAGNSLDWFKRTFGENKSYEELLGKVSEIGVGANGLLFTPFIVGERTPYFDADIRGSFLGIDTSHTLDHFVRAVLEGITFSLRESQRIIEETTQRKFTKVVSVGGGAKNRDWLQIQADIFNAEIVTLNVEEGPGLGAAMIATVGLEWFEDFQQCGDVFVNYKDSVKPIPENVDKYNEVFGIYENVYQDTKNISHQLAKID